jgi:hypothetical protein
MTIKFLENAEEIFTSIMARLGLAWWVEVITEDPSCIYYFGPFVSDKEAKLNQSGYIEDLEQEEAKIITVDIKQYQPKSLTICEVELPESLESTVVPSISRFAQFHHR